MPGIDENVPMDLSAAQSYRRSPIPMQRGPPERDTRSPGVDVHPNMDRDWPGPTDPEVFTRAQRPPTPANTIYEVPRMSVASVEAALTPGMEDLIDDVLDEINRESPDDDSLGSEVTGTIRLPDVSRPPPRYANIPATQTSHEYVAMASSTRAEACSSRGSHSLSGLSTSLSSPLALGGQCGSYDHLGEPANRHHLIGERPMLPIPQGSPPPPTQPPLSIPIYYRDYSDPLVRPAYDFICHSAWYAQVAAELALCADCATSEHTFCIYNRPNAVWRQLHLISRTFVHTTLHCGRCYKLLIKTKRAIDCHECRTTIIDLRGRTEHLTYQVLCEAVLPRGTR
ncbi:uncharacterized protein LOC112463143 [Temnothorax curvispinosus]|uniref:Uncharacterized protein LOC112463143 n=1 Tax=Temnothorax curvispinosus TaxID=300111 RepID=A0A6J1QRM1_9HYME|nr:uncharacterized protein LOC112463143 [Temnothorax curvispinosus]